VDIGEAVFAAMIWKLMDHIPSEYYIQVANKAVGEIVKRNMSSNNPKPKIKCTIQVEINKDTSVEDSQKED